MSDMLRKYMSNYYVSCGYLVPQHHNSKKKNSTDTIKCNFEDLKRKKLIHVVAIPS